MSTKEQSKLAGDVSVHQELLQAHGELVTGRPLLLLLGFKSQRSFYRAIQADCLPVKVSQIAGRRGYFARTRDVASWLESFGIEKLVAGSTKSGGEPCDP
ncbi:MAG: hypothetical protein ACRETM_13970 [Stenotrophobium sp.]